MMAAWGGMGAKKISFFCDVPLASKPHNNTNIQLIIYLHYARRPMIKQRYQPNHAQPLDK